MYLPIFSNALNYFIIGKSEPAVFSDSWGPSESFWRDRSSLNWCLTTPRVSRPLLIGLQVAARTWNVTQARWQQGSVLLCCLAQKPCLKGDVVKFTTLIVDQLRWKSRRTDGEKHTNPKHSEGWISKHAHTHCPAARIRIRSWPAPPKPPCPFPTTALTPEGTHYPEFIIS